MGKLYTKKRRVQRAKFYSSRTWRRMSETQKNKKPLCEHCLKDGILRPAKVADHIDPTWQNAKNFMQGKLQSLCAFHHNLKTQFDDLPLLRRQQKTKMRFWDG